MNTRYLFLSLLPLLWSMMSIAQQPTVLHQLPEDEQKVIEAIALYPQKERLALLEAALHPEILVRMENIRSATELKYKERLQSIPEDDQRKMYNLVRYPALMQDMSTHEKRIADREMDTLLLAYPEEIHADARFGNKKYFLLLKSIDSLYQQANDAFTSVLSAYPDDIRRAYETLVMLPGVVSILAENLSMTLLLGDIYRNNPEALIKELDSINIIVAEQRAKELDDWKQELEKNPEASKEYEAAAQEFAAEQGYDDDVYGQPAQDVVTSSVYIDDIWQPYPYWFGWPSWYAYPCWYPYPWWYYWGYYYGPGHVMVVVGLPSYVFLGWHFNYYDHYYYYPHFTDHVIDHYYGPRSAGVTVPPVLRTKEGNSNAALPTTWYKDETNRVERIQEYGKFKMDYDQTVRVSTEKAPTEREFLRSNADQYPTLKKLTRDLPAPPEPQPKKFREYEPYQSTSPGQYVPKEKIIENLKTPRPESVDRAKDIHENVWDKLRTTPRTSPPAPPRQISPSRQQPQRSPSPSRPPAPTRKN